MPTAHEIADALNGAVVAGRVGPGTTTRHGFIACSTSGHIALHRKGLPVYQLGKFCDPLEQIVARYQAAIEDGAA